MYSAAIAIIGVILELVLIARATQRRFLFEFPLFYSYIAYMILSSAAIYGVSRLRPQYHASSYWFSFLVGLLVEFAVLVEISDHIFNTYPAIRRLGRFLTLGICVTFSFYILGALIGPRSPSITILDLVKRTSLTKAAIIIILLAAARYYRLPLGQNVSGIMLGFSVYLALNVANFALAETYGRARYGQTFSIVVPLGYTLSLLVWTITLWRSEPVSRINRELSQTSVKSSEPLGIQLGRFNTALTRLLRK